jgi:hypothetical protein
LRNEKKKKILFQLFSTRAVSINFFINFFVINIFSMPVWFWCSHSLCYFCCASTK